MGLRTTLPQRHRCGTTALWLGAKGIGKPPKNAYAGTRRYAATLAFSCPVLTQQTHKETS